MHPRIERLTATPARVAALLAALTTLAYLNSFSGVPQFDDYAVIIDEPRVASLAAWWHSMPGIRPLLKLSYALNSSVDGMFGFHLVNLAIHLGNVLLAWRLLLRLLPAEPAAAILGALLFALHPVNTEAVMLLSARSVALGALGMLGSLVALLAGRTVLSLALFALAVLVRETALVLPALALLCLAWIGWREGRNDALRHAVRVSRWHWVLALGALVLLLCVPRYRELLAFSFAIRSPLANLVTEARASLYLLAQLAWPFALNSDPRLPVFTHWEVQWLAACALWVLALGWSLTHVRRGSWLAFLLLWFVLALAPTNSLIARIDIANDRQLYLAALPLFAALILLPLRLIERWERNLGSGLIFGTKIGPDPTFRRAQCARSVSCALAMLLIATLLFATMLRNRDYYTETAFWSAVLACDQQNPRAWNNLGFALEREQGDALSALTAYDRAIALDPGDYKPRHNRIALCARLPREPRCATR